MPPLPNEEESSSADELPYKAKKAAAKDESDAGDSDEEEVDEYVIEKIVGHQWGDDGEVLYDVKWEGWDDPNDRTLEPEENLETAKESLQGYWKEIGGKPEKKAAKGGRKRKAGGPGKGSVAKRAKSETPELSAKKKRRGTDVKEEFRLPKGSWEEQVANIDTIEEAVDEKGEMQRFVYVLWNNGNKTRHQLTTVNQKCPQKMLRYYESHLVFRAPEADNNGEV